MSTFFAIAGPSLPYELGSSAMAESPDGKGVMVFGGFDNIYTYEDKILELQPGANNWNIFDITLERGRYRHIVIPIPWKENEQLKLLMILF